MRSILRLFGILCMMQTSCSVFIYAPGVAAPMCDQNKAVRDATYAARNLRIFSADAEVHTEVYTDQRVAIIADAAQSHTVYVPLFVDYYPKVGLGDRYIAQERDIADMCYVHAYAAYRHDGPIHMIGHSRGGGTIATYAGLLWYDIDYLHALLHTHCFHLIDVYINDQKRFDATLRSQLGALCLIGAFDNLGETLKNIIDVLWMPHDVKQYVANRVPSWYTQLDSIIPVPRYDWSSPYRPRTMITHVPSYIPCICVHTDRDPINPAAVARDIYHTRCAIAPDRSYLHIIPNTMTLPFRHIEVPYFYELPDVFHCLMQAVQSIEQECTLTDFGAHPH